MSDYIERLRGELMRVEATQPRLRLKPALRPVLALTAVAAVVVAVLVFMPGTPDREVPVGASSTYHVEGGAQATAQVLRERMAALGVMGEVTVSGDTVTVPEAARALAVPGRLAVYDSEQGRPGRPAFGNAAIKSARPGEDPMTSEPIVVLQLTSAGEREFEALTRTVSQRGKQLGEPQHFAIAVDGRVYSEPYIDWRYAPNGIDGSEGMHISGNFTPAQARELAAVLDSGPLPGKLD
jgi:hypothetical protein